MAETTQAIAARCLEDAEFAKQILEGDEYPEVRGAIIADLEDEKSVQGYIAGTGQNFINPQPMPPSPATAYSKALIRQPLIWNNWNTYQRFNLQQLTLRR